MAAWQSCLFICHRSYDIYRTAQKKKQVYLGELQREDHESMRKLQEQMTELREQLYFDKK